MRDEKDCAGIDGEEKRGRQAGDHRSGLERIFTGDVIVPEGRRKINEEVVQALMESLAAYGLQTPITVWVQEDTWVDDTCWENVPVLVAGGHRLEAARRLGWERIDAFVVEYDDLRKAELWEIDENLCRSELSPTEYSAAVARRKALYEELRPETRHGGDRGNQHAGGKVASRKVCDLPKSDCFTKDTAEKTGRSERSVQLAARRGEAIAPDVLQAIQGTRLDTGSYQDRIAKLDHEAQRKTIREDLATPRPPKQLSAWPEAEDSAARIAELVAEHIPEERWDEFGYHLGKATAARVVQALARIAVRSESPADWCG